MGDSFNDTAMLAESQPGNSFRPSEKVLQEFPQFPVAREYDEVKDILEKLSAPEANSFGWNGWIMSEKWHFKVEMYTEFSCRPRIPAWFSIHPAKFC